MTTAALAQLAERTMGCAQTAPDPVYDIGRGAYCIELYANGASSVWLRQTDSSTSAIWRPHEDPAQALALLEAWCDRSRERWYRHDRLLSIENTIFLFDRHTMLNVVQGDTFAEAATFAVCAAMGIDPEAEA